MTRKNSAGTFILHHSGRIEQVTARRLASGPPAPRTFSPLRRSDHGTRAVATEAPVDGTFSR